MKTLCLSVPSVVNILASAIVVCIAMLLLIGCGRTKPRDELALEACGIYLGDDWHIVRKTHLIPCYGVERIR
jgi:hypothetical protein